MKDNNTGFRRGKPTQWKRSGRDHDVYYDRRDGDPPDHPHELVCIRLFHGRLSPDTDMDDWGTDGPYLGPFLWVHPTYTSRIWLGDPITGHGMALSYYEDMVYYDGVFYGDHSIMSEGSGRGTGLALEFPTEARLEVPPVLGMRCVVSGCDMVERRALHQHPVRCHVHPNSPGMTVAQEGMTLCAFCRTAFSHQLGSSYFQGVGVVCRSCTLLSGGTISTIKPNRPQDES